jgi:CBS domain-containing protein
MLPTHKLKYVVGTSTTLRDAMVLIDQNRRRTLIIVSGEQAVGTLSDGDVRRALLDGHIMETPVASVMNTHFVALKVGEERAAVDIFAAGDIFLVPVVDDENRLVDILEK